VSFDDDGYLVGERVIVRSKNTLYFDEITGTRAAIGPFTQPSLVKRWDLLEHPNYTQVLVTKRFNSATAASLDYTSQSGADTFRASLTLLPKNLDSKLRLRVEGYRRTNAHADGGFAAWADRSFGRVRVQAGYVTVDQFYGGWNADRVQSGRRAFAVVNVPIRGPVSAQVFGTQSIGTSFPIPLKQRLDVVVSYDVLWSLRRLGLF
jgi:hypothetical protein